MGRDPQTSEQDIFGAGDFHSSAASWPKGAGLGGPRALFYFVLHHSTPCRVHGKADGELIRLVVMSMAGNAVAAMLPIGMSEPDADNVAKGSQRVPGNAGCNIGALMGTR